MDERVSPPQSSLGLTPPLLKDLASDAAPKDWPHAPVHRLTKHGVYFITAGTLHKLHLFNTPAKRDLLERMLLSLSNARGWQLEAWAILSNHYHFVARGNPDATHMKEFLREFHSRSAIELNRIESAGGRTVWHNFWDTRLTYQYSYLTRLNYVHQNAVKHGLVTAANQYPWCSAAWFERTASPAQVKTIYSLKIDKVVLADDY
jgi:putative transposase